MKILFALVDGGGNVPPQLAVARALQRRGAQVHVIGHRGLRERVEAAGLTFESFAGGRHFDPIIQRSLAALMTSFVRAAADRRLGDCVVESARRHDADVVVVDMILAAGVRPGREIRPSDRRFRALLLSSGSGPRGVSPVGWMLRLRGTDPLGAEHQGLLQIVSARADLDPMRGTPAVRHTGVAWQRCRREPPLRRQCHTSSSASVRVRLPDSVACSRTSWTRSLP